jgi:hypothetical protein
MRHVRNSRLASLGSFGFGPLKPKHGLNGAPEHPWKFSALQPELNAAPPTTKTNLHRQPDQRSSFTRAVERFACAKEHLLCITTSRS